MDKTLPIGVLSISVMLGISISGCITKPTPRLQEITLELKWLHQAQFAGNYVAVKKGYYAAQGLNVTLVPFSFEAPTIDAVIHGNATFGITRADELIVARSKGLPLKAFAVIYKINPVCAYSLKKSGIITPQDFIGKTVGLEGSLTGTTNVNILYFAMMSKLGTNKSQIHEVITGYDATELLNGTTNVSTGYIINEPYQVMIVGYEVNTILMADYGVNMYADVLFTTEDTLNNSPELIEGFLRATLQGWQYAFEHINETVNITLQYTPNNSRNLEAYMLTNSIPFIHTCTSSLGWMEKSEWEHVQNILFEQHILDTPINIDNVYTMDFLEKINK